MLTPDEESRLLEIVARAACPAERRDEAIFEPVPTPDDVLDERLAAFARAAAGGDAARHADLLSARGISIEAFRAGLSDVRCPDRERLPTWGRDLLELVEAAFETTVPDLGFPPEDRVGRALAPFVWQGARRVGLAVAASSLTVEREAEIQMIQLVAGRLHGPSVHALAGQFPGRGPSLGLLDARTAPAPEVEERWGRRSTWLDFFETYPVLARNLAIAWSSVCRTVAELLERLEADREEIGRVFFDGRAPASLVRFEGGLGDTHDGGRTVALLQFEEGRRLAYKPRDLRVARWYFDLVESLGQTPVHLHRRSVLLRPDHAWEEFVAGAACRSADEVESYYRSIGGLLRLMQLLEARDLHKENILARGAEPVPIDLEDLLQPRRQPPTELGRAALALIDRVEESALPIGILPMPLLSEPGRRAVDLGALASPRPVRSPFKFAQVERTDRDGLRSYLGYGQILAGHSTPRLDDEPVGVGEHLDRVLGGYVAMDGHLRDHRDRLADPALLEAAGSMPVRVLFRPTHVYARLLHSSFQPAFLRDGVRWEACLANLWKTFAKDPDRPVAVTESEIAALRRLDVPIFHGLPGGDVALLDGGGVVPGTFSGRPLDRMRARIEALGDRPESADDDVAIVRTALAIHDESPAGPLSTRPIRLPETDSTEGPWLEAALGIADRLVADRVEVDGEATWLGINYVPWADHWVLERLDTSLLSGTSGLAVLFAELSARTGRADLADVARACLAMSDRAVDEMAGLLAPAETTGRSDPVPCGFLYGTGSIVHASLRAAAALGDERLARPAGVLAGWIDPERPPVCAGDLVSGLAGLAVALLPARPDLAIGLAGHLRSPEGRSDPAHPPESRFLERLPPAGPGLALALLSIDEAVGQASDGSPLEEALVGDLARPSVGGLLCALAGLRFVPDRADEVAAALDRFLDRVDGGAMDLLDRIELRLAAASLERPTDAVDARRAARRLLDLRATRGTWFPESEADDRHRPSAVHGVGAIAHALLRLDDPARLGPIRIPPGLAR